MTDCLVTNDLCKSYRNFKALHRLNMHIPKGAIYGFVGKNGAGKTTLIRQICGLQNPTSGSYSIYGVKNTDPAIRKMQKRMGAVVETPAIYQDMTAAENLDAAFFTFFVMVMEKNCRSCDRACGRNHASDPGYGCLQPSC